MHSYTFQAVRFVYSSIKNRQFSEEYAMKFFFYVFYCKYICSFILVYIRHVVGVVK